MYTVEEFKQKISDGSELLPYSDEEIKEFNETLDYFDSINEKHEKEIKAAKDETAKKWREKMQERFQDIPPDDNDMDDNDLDDNEEDKPFTLDDLYKWKEL